MPARDNPRQFGAHPTPGTRPLEVSALIGKGGVGEVYRATDTNLARQVAITVLPEAVARTRARRGEPATGAGRRRGGGRS